MIYVVLAVFGLCLGSFVNALVWRMHEQSKGQKTKKSKTGKKNLSILNGRSMCVHCHHELSWKDLIPVVSWLSLGGKCRYCRKSISWQYPVVELATAVLFLLSYAFYPASEPLATFTFVVWLVMLTGFMALLVYDIRWMLLPNRIVYPLIALAAVQAVAVLLAEPSTEAFYNLILSVIVGGGLFLVLFQISDGKWIGGGDVKLGLLSGLLLADPYQAFLMLLLASTLGTLMVLPAVASKRLKASSRIAFGPFLIIATIIVKLFGASVIEWYRNSLY